VTPSGRPDPLAVAPAQALDAQEVAVTVSERLRNLAGLTPGPRVTRPWNPCSLADGDVGLALLCGYAARCLDDAAWAAASHEFLSSAASAAQTRQLGPGLFDGFSGLGFAGAVLSGGNRRYERLTASVDAAVGHYLSFLISRQDGSATTPLPFDVVSGLAGVGVYLLQRSADERPSRDLVSVVELLAGHQALPPPTCWWTSGRALAHRPLGTLFPDGCVDCGFAHGVPGPLAFLARAWMHGVRTPQNASAIEATVSWLLAHQAPDGWGSNWPLAVPLPSTTTVSDRGQLGSPGARAGWCYGSPGVARAIWLAGEALDRPDWCELAVAAMKAVYRRPADLRQISTPSLCHGTAGLLLISLHFFHDTHDADFADQVAALTSELLEAFDPAHPFGFVNHEREDHNNPGLLDGAAGVAATLLAVATKVSPTWDQALLIA
jgi:lantibiotic biosynthesis protein